MTRCGESAGTTLIVEVPAESQASYRSYDIQLPSTESCRECEVFLQPLPRAACWIPFEEIFGETKMYLC